MTLVVPAVVLAAGKSTRMGRPKAVLPLTDTDTFISRIVRTLLEAGVDDVVVVLGCEADVIAEGMLRAGLTARVAINEAFETGQFSSVLRGLNAVDRPGVTGMLLTLVDVPLVSASTIRAVLDRHLASRAPIVRPVRGTDHGHPVIIDRSLFGALRAADPSTGAKPIVRGHVSPGGDVVVDDDGAFIDIDTPEEYTRALGRAFI
jgi:molybdenum cofactor cytidylyltransferase